VPILGDFGGIDRLKRSLADHQRDAIAAQLGSARTAEGASTTRPQLRLDCRDGRCSGNRLAFTFPSPRLVAPSRPQPAGTGSGSPALSLKGLWRSELWAAPVLRGSERVGEGRE